MHVTTKRTEAGATPGMFVQAEGSAKRPGIILLQEIFGLNASMAVIAQHFAASGYDVFAPDLFWRQQPGVILDPTKAEDRARAQDLMKGLNEESALEDIAKSVVFLKGLDTASGKVAAIGYCLGGRLAYLAAVHGQVDTAISYYGVAIDRSLNLADRVDVPMLMHVAEEDPLCDRHAQQELKDKLAQNDMFDLHFHPGVGHAFARPNSPAWNEAAASRANAATLAFLSDALSEDLRKSKRHPFIGTA